MRRLLSGRRRSGEGAELLELQAIEELRRSRPMPLSPQRPSPEGPLDVAVVVPHFRTGSGGHTTIANIVRGLEGRGHRCSIWIFDPAGRSAGPGAFREWFGPFDGPVHGSLEGFDGAHVAVATGWQTVSAVLQLSGCAARAYLVQDHEPDFYPVSVERLWATESYGQGLHAITAGPWLAEVARGYGATATAFDLGIDHATYSPRGSAAASPDRVLFYARTATARRGVPLGLMALAEVMRRRPPTEVVLFGEAAPPSLAFRAGHLGIVNGPALAAAYSNAGVGLVLSLTNYSLVAQEMLACGLPAVELETPSTRAAFGPEPPLELVAAEAQSIADGILRLLENPGLHDARRAAGLLWAAERTWSRASAQVEDGLRTALRTAAGD
jgi:glycosyltransferase involved in cell wall biosynthesis